MRLQRGDIGRLERLVHRYQTQALRAAQLVTRDRALAEDVVQAAFLAIPASHGPKLSALRSRPRVSHASKTASWAASSAAAGLRSINTSDANTR